MRSERLRCGAVVLAAGAGTRLSSEVPKQFLRLGGRPIVLHAIDGLLSSGVIAELVIVAHSEWIQNVSQMVETHLESRNEDVKISIVLGGATRNESTAAGLAALSDHVEVVVVHDGARPFIDGRTVRRSVEPILSGSADATDVVIPTSDTIVEVDETGRWVKSVPERARLRRGQTPQVFRKDVLARAYAAAGHRESPGTFTDDIGILLDLEPLARVATIEGSPTNLKVTYQEDLMTADALLRRTSPVVPSLGQPLDAEDRTAVFGGTSGIGQAVIELLVERGVPAFGGSRRTGHDITTASGRAAFLRDAGEHLGPVRHLVISAGDLDVGPITALTEARIEHQVRANFLGALLTARGAVKRFGDSLESVTFLGSSSYSLGRANYAVYSAAKAALVAATQALSEEWTDAGVRVNIVVPERTRTPLRRRHFGDEPGPMLSPQDVASDILHVIAGPSSGLVVQVKDGVRVDRTAPAGESSP